MTKHRLFIYFAAGIIIAAAMAFSFQVGSVQGERLIQTWPSRTPTPEGGPQNTPTNEPPPQPTDDPGGGNSSTATPQSGPTNTPAGDQDPANTPVATVVLSTPEGGYEATAEPCGYPPTVQARGLVNVRMGPGLDYEPIDSLIFLETRPIIGRAEFATWWLIQLPGNTTGWVADQAVSVQGYTGLVPIIDAPELDGATPTPGPLWEPTPNPVCTPLPTPTPTLTPTLETAEVSITAESNTNPTEEPIDPTSTPSEQPATSEPSETPTVVPQASPTTAEATSTSNPVSDSQETPSEEEGGNNGDSAASASSMILIIGIGLVLVGAVSYIIRSR